jgi:hypothetical protein
VLSEGVLWLGGFSRQFERGNLAHSQFSRKPANSLTHWAARCYPAPFPAAAYRTKQPGATKLLLATHQEFRLPSAAHISGAKEKDLVS